jgi:type II secretory pathway component PulM
MKATAQDIQTSLAGLGRQTQWQTQIDNVRTAVTNMNAAADNIAASPGARGATGQVRISVAQVNEALRRLLAAVGSRCPSPSPSGS